MFSINGEMWRVQLVRPDHPALYMTDGYYALGACYDENKTIYINRYLSDSMFEKVLCHELVHAAMFSYNVELILEEEELIAEIIATFGEEIIDITDILFDRIGRGRR